MAVKVLKFGSSALGDAEACRRAAAIARAELPAGGLLLISCLKGTGEALLESLAAAARGQLPEALTRLQRILAHHRTVAQELGLLERILPSWESEFSRLEALLEGIALVGEATTRTRDAALAIGETLAARLLDHILLHERFPTEFRDLREVLRTKGRHGHARPDLAALGAAAEPWRTALQGGARYLSQASVGQGPDGTTTNLGRGGSDLTATLLGEALGAEEVQIWTDVDGILSADPSLVPEARPIPAMSLAEAAALSAFGDKVLHADSLAPAARAGFRLVVANTRRPSASRTTILPESPARARGEVTSVAYKEGVAALRFPPGFSLEELLTLALRLEDAGAHRYGLLSNPEGALLVLRTEGPAAETVLTELADLGITVERGWAVVALVGEGLRLDPGAPARLLAPLVGECLGAVLGGSSGASVAFLVPETRLAKLIPSLHRCFILDGACAAPGA